MRKKLVFGIVLVLTLLLLMPSITAIQHKTMEEVINQDSGIEFIFAFGRVKDVEKYPDELLYQFRSVSLLIVWFYFYRIDLAGLMIDYSRGVATSFHGFKFIGILTNRFIFGFFLP